MDYFASTLVNESHTLSREAFEFFNQIGPFWIGTFMVCENHLRLSLHSLSCVQKLNSMFGRPHRSLKRVGFHFCVFAIYYGDDMFEWVRAHPSVCMICLVLFDGVFLNAFVEPWLNYLVFRYQGGSTSMSCASLRNAYMDHRWDNDPDDDPDEDAMSDNVYMDLTKPFNRVVILFVVQLMLLSFYLEALVDTEKQLVDDTKRSLGYWVLAVLIETVAAEAQFGSTYNHAFWRKILSLDPASAELIASTRYVCWRIPITYRTDWLLRSYMDYFINDLGKRMLMFSFPIMLSVQLPMDFVMNCTAIFFLTSLDDVAFDEAKSFETMTARLKFNVAYEHLLSDGDIDEIPVRLTEGEAAATEFNENIWDQFSKQREFVCPNLGVPLIEHMRENRVAARRSTRFGSQASSEFDASKPEGNGCKPADEDRVRELEDRVAYLEQQLRKILQKTL
eukprot:TRINITY_DN34300_c0_g1_i1.p1 TRINITY_DN34300_c0_g1~~TRINITY_DN34300_c0_g1_i1.p1  ORF type:complete len:448 (+),score=63.40 TRINITY_DN34300_c0_g1_i1:68-1411(+)